MAQLNVFGYFILSLELINYVQYDCAFADVPSAHTRTVTLTDPARWYSRAPGDLSLAWDPAHLEDGDYGWADNTTYHTVDVTLYAYVENLLANGTTVT